MQLSSKKSWIQMRTTQGAQAFLTARLSLPAQLLQQQAQQQAVHPSGKTCIVPAVSLSRAGNTRHSKAAQLLRPLWNSPGIRMGGCGQALRLLHHSHLHFQTRRWPGIGNLDRTG